MECLYGFLSNISRDLVCGAVNQLRYPCCFNNFVEELEKEERSLTTTIKDVKARIAHEKKQSRRTAEVVHKWDEDADKYVDDVNQLLNKARTKQNCCFGHCPDWIFRYRSGKKLAKKKTELKEFINRGGPYVLFERAVTLPSGIPNSSSEKYLSFGSRQKAYEELMEAVKDDNVGMIGLYGMGGCGKTTMAMEVLKKVEAEHLFDKVLFVPVSSTVEVRRIQDKIASSLQYTFPENEERERAKRLNERLKIENKVLVILDDVWEKLDFDSIGIPSTEHHKGCKVLITTRSEDVCTLNDCQKKIQLHILTDEEAWDLFQKQAHIFEGTSDTLKHLARQISDECKGLLVAIAAVASTLKGKDEKIWEVALNRLKSSKPINIEKGLQDPYKCLELSYHNLDNEEAKSLFLLCSVYPEDYEIPIELLTRNAIGLGLVGEVRSYEEARSEVIAAKIKLMSCCLLLDANDEIVKMHDLVRNVAHLIAKNENKGIKCEVENDVTLEQNTVRYLWCKKLPNDLDCSNLEFLCITTEVEVLHEIFTRMGKLRVLFLKNERWIDWRPELSTMSFKTLTNLCCLILWGWKLSDISFVRYTKKLESLSLNECSLPSFLDLQKDDAVTQLTKLKSLVLNSCEMERNSFEVIGRIPQLEEFIFVHHRDNIEFFKSFSVPQTLQRYTITLEIISRHMSFFNPPERTLMLDCFDISNEAIMGLAKTAKILCMGNVKGGLKNIIPSIFELEGGSMPELNELYISGCEEIECLVDSSNYTSEVVGSLFSSLESLELTDCPQLTYLFTQVITPNPVRYTIFQNLQQVQVYGCRELKYVFSANTVGGLPQLEWLRIEDCNKLEQIVEDIIPSVANELEMIEENTSTPSPPLVNHSPGSFTLSKLRSVEVYSCPKLGLLFPASTPKTFISLVELDIKDCPGLKHLLSWERDHNKKQNKVEDDDLQSVISMFPSLQTLRIERCRLLHHIFPVFPVSVVRCLPELEYLEIRECEELNHIMEEDENDRIKLEVEPCFPKLKKVVVRQCQKLKCLFSTSASNDLPSLEDLNIYEADELEEIIGFEHGASVNFQCLRSLEITTCARLEVVFPVSVVRCMPELQYLEIRECEELKYIMEEDDNDRIQREVEPCFSKLKKVIVRQCHKLKRLFCTCASNDLPNLEDLIIHEATELEELFGCKQGASKNSFTLQHLKTLEITECAKLELIFPVSVVRCLPELEHLVIEECKELKHIMEEDENERIQRELEPCFPKLKKVVVKQCQKLKHLFSTPAYLPNLEDLIIHEAAELEELFGCKQGASKNSFTLQHLKTLKITECAKLELIFPVFVVRCLPELERLVIEECKELKQIMEEDENERIQRELEPCFPKLKNVVVKQCQKLKHLFSTPASNDLPNLEYLIIYEAAELEELFGRKQGASKNSFTLQHLKTLEIIECAKLELIFPVSVVRCLPELELLVIEECKELKHIMEEDENERIQRELEPCFPKLKKVFVKQCQKLKHLFSTPASNDLPNLKDLIIHEAAELEELFECKQGASKNSFTLQHLQTLKITECAKLEVMFPLSVVRCLPELELLYISQCEELKQIMEEEEVEDKKLSNIVSPQPCFPKLKEVLVKKCHKLKRLFSTSASNDLPNLEILIINGADELEALIGCEQREDEEIGKAKVELQKLKLLIFMHLSNLCQGIELRAVKHYIITNCPKLSLTSMTTLRELCQNFPRSDFENIRLSWWDIESLICEINESNEVSKRGSTSEFSSWQINEELEKEFMGEGHGSEVHDTAATSTYSELDGRSSPSPLDIHQHETLTGVVNGQSTSGSYMKDQQMPLGETESTIAISQNMKIGVKEGTASENAMLVSSHLESTSSQSDSSQHKSYAHEWDSKLENTSPLLMNQEDPSPSTSKSKSLASQVNDNNQSIPGSIAEMVCEHKQIQNEAPVSKTDEFLELERERKMTSHSQWLELRLSLVSSPNMTENIEEIGKEIIQEGSKSMRATIKTLSTGVESISLGSGGTPDTESSGGDILTQHSQVVDQDDKLNEGKKGIQIQEELNLMDKKEGIGMVSDNSIEVPPGSNLIDKEDEIGVVSNDHIVARINEEPEKEFVAKISTSEIPTIATSLKNSGLVERSSPSYLDIRLHKTHSNFVQGLVNRQSMSEPCWMNQKKPLGEFISSPEISQNIKSVAKEGTISNNTDMAALSMHSESAILQSGQLVTSQSKSNQHSPSKNVTTITQKSPIPPTSKSVPLAPITTKVAEPSKPVDKSKKKMVDQPKTSPKPVGEKLMSSAINSAQREVPALSSTPQSSDSGDQKSASRTVRAIPAPKKVGELSQPTTQKELEIHQVSSTAVGGDNQEPLVEISHDSTAEVTSLLKSPTIPVSATDVEIVEPSIDAQASKANLSMLEDIGESHPSEEVVEETAMKQDPKNDESETSTNPLSNPLATYTTPDDSDDEFKEDFKSFDILTEWEQGLIQRAECETFRTSFRQKAFNVDILTIASDENLKVEVQEAAAKLLSFGGLVPEKERIRIQMFLDLLEEVVSKVKLQKNQQIQIENIKNTSLDPMNQIEFAKQQANTSKLSFKENKSELVKLDASKKVLIEKIAALQLKLSSVQIEKQTLESRQNDLRQTIRSSAAHAKSVAEQLKAQLEKISQLETSQVELAESLESLKKKQKTQGQNYFM